LNDGIAVLLAQALDFMIQDDRWVLDQRLAQRLSCLASYQPRFQSLNASVGTSR
jgi:hypothetical protein